MSPLPLFEGIHVLAVALVLPRARYLAPEVIQQLQPL